MDSDIASLIDTADSITRFGLIVERLPDGSVRANVPHVPFHSPNGFECAYAGSGPAELALAVMHALLPPLLTPEEQRAAYGDDTTTPRADLDQLLDDPQNWSQAIGPRQVHVSDLAFGLHQRFKWRFLANPNNKDALHIPIEEIRAWIASERAKVAS